MENCQHNSLLIVDGNNLLFQMFYGMPTKIYNKRGRTIHATIGFISALQREIRTYNIHRCVVVFDCDASAERKALDAEYKANRPQNWEELPKDEVPFFEEEFIRQCLSFLGVCVLDSCDMEADDLIASIAIKEQASSQVFISSFDSDFYQLINEKVSILRYRGQHTKQMDLSAFKDEFSFLPNTYALYKSLVGDSADNVRGIDGIGKKRATEIVRRYQDFDQLKNGDCSFLPLKTHENLKNNLERVQRNLSLIQLRQKTIQSYWTEFDNEKMQWTNSQILSACHIFD